MVTTFQMVLVLGINTFSEILEKKKVTHLIYKKFSVFQLFTNHGSTLSDFLFDNAFFQPTCHS